MTQGVTYRSTIQSIAPVLPVSRPAHGSPWQGLRRLFRADTCAVGLPPVLVRDVDPDLHAATTELTSAWQRLDGHLRPSIY